LRTLIFVFRLLPLNLQTNRTLGDSINMNVITELNLNCNSTKINSDYQQVYEG
jgi:hypothetical protein